MIRAILSLFSPQYPKTLVYMLQSNEYHAGPYLNWYWHTNDFSKVAKRKSLVMTRPARLLTRALSLGMLLQISAGLYIIYLGSVGKMTSGVEFGLAVLLSYPLVWAHLLLVPLVLGRLFIVKPKERRAIAKSSAAFSQHRATVIAVAGSYGKTTMKEILGTVISSGKKVEITPANKNVSLSHAKFVEGLSGKEEVLIVEYGEGAPGDVERFNRIVQPDIGVITGLAPAHLDKYKTIEAAGKDIFSLADYLHGEQVYVNGESPSAASFIKKAYTAYDRSGTDTWRISRVKLFPDHMTFVASKDKRELRLHTSLVGRHLLGTLAAAITIADRLGLDDKQIAAGIANTKPYEHRMQPYNLHGAWIIDDTYNGNIEGIRAGTELLKELTGNRKMYVTPGLVDQGKETQRVHEEMGRLIAEAKPDKVVLMRHSVTKWIEAGLKQGNYQGEIDINDEPLDFYTNLEKVVAAGDIVMMQNDWPDNYH